MIKSAGKIIAGFLIGAIAFIGAGAYGAFNPQAPAIPLSVQVYRVAAGLTANLFLGYADLTWLGADPTGVGDSTTAFTEAAALGINLTLDCGSYNVNSTITFSAGISNSLTGSGAPCTTIYKGTNNAVFQINEPRFALTGVAIQGNSASPSVPAPQPASGSRGFSDTSNCIVIGVAGSMEPFGVHLTDIVADHCGSAGVDHEDGDSLILSGNISARHNAQWGYYKTTSCTFTNQCGALPIAGIGLDVDEDRIDGILAVSDNGYGNGFTASGGAEFGAFGNTGSIRAVSNYGDGVYVNAATNTLDVWGQTNGVMLGSIGAWTTGHAYTTGAFVYNATTTTTGFLYQATNSGNAGASPPTCARLNTCSDGTVTWRNRGGMDIYMADNGLNTPSGFNANNVRLLYNNGNCLTAGSGNNCTVGSVPAPPPAGLVGSVSLSQAAGLSIAGPFIADQVTVATAVGSGYYTVPVPSIGLSMNGNLSSQINAMDTGSPPASGFVDIYWIFNPNTGTLALLGCADASCNRTNLYGNGHFPSGYTASALAAVLPTDAVKDFKTGGVHGRTWSYAACPQVFAGVTGSASLSAQSIAGQVPLGAISVDVIAANGANTAAVFAIAGDGSGTGNTPVDLGTGAGSGVASGCGITAFITGTAAGVPIFTSQRIWWLEANTRATDAMYVRSYSW